MAQIDHSGSYMFIGISSKNRLKTITNEFGLESKQNKLNTKIVDVLEDKKSIGIKDIREAIAYTDKAPSQNKYKYLVIPQAELLTTEAQNALLKTLEEPPTYAIIALGVSAEGKVLETVASRCKKIYIKSLDLSTNTKELNFAQINTYTLGKKLAIVEELAKSDKNELLTVLESWITEIRNGYLNGQVNKNSSNNIKLILEIREDLQRTAVNTRFALEHLVFSIK